MEVETKEPLTEEVPKTEDQDTSAFRAYLVRSTRDEVGAEADQNDDRESFNMRLRKNMQC